MFKERLKRVGNCFYSITNSSCGVLATVFEAEVSFPAGVDFPCVEYSPLGSFTYLDIWDSETLEFVIHTQFLEVKNGKTPKNWTPR